MKIICVGRNYTEHAKELKNEIPTEPVLFIKPDTSVLKGSDFYIPEFSNDIHYELELVIKISKGGKYIQEENAAKHYEQIGLGIDFTARDLQSKLKEKGLPWEKAKGFDGSAVVSDFFPVENFNTEEIHFELKKNNQTVQEGNSKDMIFDINKLIANISQYFTLRVGDLIFTGTPAGVGKVEENDILDAYLENEKLFSVKVH
ncbi:TPA: fumarylacetoacetate hydrolase family protein [Elizabethkingia anophelis]|uniref:2-keto-4-pentenoate hydratase/2-oxohepta-3-ene-1,7-dioic acid hydratase in catechol pathway n=1 Tax=Elizabethkingia miricola TaxID=172045 RepID=A0AAQ3I5V9_ELIMR|nr:MULTISPECIES: fumarylacetoacetate hydrolase family protein [Elizabethkingia]EQB91228.1 2-hydroxyhepta-2,4-diene-1,7-dioate isomerase [Elizabethkingia anophelis 502]KUG10239.1 2-hydroxyhepta-2,4-diene-1,7-dioate isomerase [Elizabethkingia miricola]MCL1655835.1 fumarylacetoacetate hydrolase family protein [Elizabethkingia miricola]MCT3701178.1 fumarylacetoacetate hydrolase family protein [Elizabethkingia anophelis]MCT3962002.1 fumarylacetoacetate hydrolase family protein [Elizabethkingia anop